MLTAACSLSNHIVFLNALLTYCYNCFISAYSAIPAATPAATQCLLALFHAFTVNSMCFALLLYVTTDPHGSCLFCNKLSNTELPKQSKGGNYLKSRIAPCMLQIGWNGAPGPLEVLCQLARAPLVNVTKGSGRSLWGKGHLDCSSFSVVTLTW